mmetsp:Transcript_67634/g.135823  ORF Transcript_67634/g.135823 Transcript_67634/m.135823 type:complete len:463 (-) Transcript_67634:82-1470(-)
MMGLCRGLFKVLLLIVLTIVAIVCCLFIPGVEREYISVTHRYLGSLAVTSALVYFPVAFRHAMEYGVPICMAPWWNPMLITAIDGHKGDGVYQAPLFNLAMRVSHASVRAMHYDPKLQRRRDVFVEWNTTRAPPGYFGAGVLPTFLQLNTDDPVRLQRRDLVVATMPALAETPSSVESFQPLPDSSAEELVSEVKRYVRFPVGIVPVKIQDVYAFNFFRHAFEVDLSRAELELLKEWTGVNFYPLLGLGSESGAARSTEIREVLLKRVAEGPFGRRFLAEAARRGVNGEECLRQTLWQFVFAGFGGNAPGGALATKYVLTKIQSAPQTYVPMFRRDPRAFVLESLRMSWRGHRPHVRPRSRDQEADTGRRQSRHGAQGRHDRHRDSSRQQGPGGLRRAWAEPRLRSGVRTRTRTRGSHPDVRVRDQRYPEVSEHDRLLSGPALLHGRLPRSAPYQADCRILR